MGGDRIIPKFLPRFSYKEGEGKKIAARRYFVFSPLNPNY
jgi:hypothetical protein